MIVPSRLSFKSKTPINNPIKNSPPIDPSILKLQKLKVKFPQSKFLPPKKTDEQKSLDLINKAKEDIKAFVSEKDIENGLLLNEDEEKKNEFKINKNNVKGFKKFEDQVYTEHEKKRLKRIEQRKEEEVKKKSNTSYSEKFDKYSKYLTSLLDHNDLPKVGPG